MSDATRWLSREDLTLKELIEASDALLPDLVGAQTRYKVTSRLDARTVRYYVTRKLLPKPNGYAGGRARYGRTHLLRLLMLKRLQAEDRTLRQITQLLPGLTDAEIGERLFGEAPAALTEAPGEARELTVGPGAVVRIPDGVLDDPALRRRLASELETLAAWLKAPGKGEAR